MQKLTDLHLDIIENHLVKEVYEEITLVLDPDERENLASKSAEITKDVAIKFAKYVDSSSFYYNEKEIWKSTATEDVKTSDKLFEEFLKQYNGTIK